MNARPGTTRKKPSVGIAPALVAGITYWILSAAEAWAWGPATHVRLAHEVLSTLSLLPAGVAGIVSKYAVDYVFGSLAADVVFAKKRSRIKQVCHQWPTGFDLFRSAPWGVGTGLSDAASSVELSMAVPESK